MGSNHGGHPKLGRGDGDGHRLRERRHHVARASRQGHLWSQHRYHGHCANGGIGNVWWQRYLHNRVLVAGQCTPQVGAEYISLAQNAERVADHFINVGKSTRNFA